MGGDHSSNTCEPSHPHGNPEHVDEININDRGKADGHSSKHNTDGGWLSFGRQKESHDKGKRK